MAKRLSGTKTASSVISPPALLPAPATEFVGTASDPALPEDLALALLKHSDLRPETLEALSKNAGVMKGRKLKLALVAHPRTPRHVSLPMLRHLFTFDLMQVALLPAVPADIKKAADEALVTRLESISYGERLTLARRASGRVAEALLRDKEAKVVRTALENARLTEAAVVKALMRTASSAVFVEAVCRHAKWSLRREVRIALLRNEKTPLARALEYARSLSPALVRDILHNSRLSARVKTFLEKEFVHGKN